MHKSPLDQALTYTPITDIARKKVCCTL